MADVDVKGRSRARVLLLAVSILAIAAVAVPAGGGVAAAEPATDAPGPTASAAGTVEATQLAAAENLISAVTTSGLVSCWGSNAHGQITPDAYGGNIAWPTVVPIGEGVTATAIATGGDHVCALTTTGTLRCWGANDEGQIGNGTAGADVLTATEVSLPGGLLARSVAAGWSHTCAVSTTDRTFCWGQNGFGQLGLGTAGGRVLVPTEVTMPSGTHATAVTAAVNTTCALIQPGASVACWGNNQRAQTGRGDVNPYQLTSPSEIIGNWGAFTSLAMGATSACGTTTAGLVCWGQGAGLGTYGPAVRNLEGGATAAAVGLGADRSNGGTDTTCAVTGSGGLQCFGSNGSGQVGVGGQTTNVGSPTPIALPGGVTVTAAAASNSASCALAADGRVLCWGSEASGHHQVFPMIDTPAFIDLDGQPPLPTPTISPAVVAPGSDATVSAAICGTGTFNVVNLTIGGRTVQKAISGNPWSMATTIVPALPPGTYPVMIECRTNALPVVMANFAPIYVTVGAGGPGGTPTTTTTTTTATSPTAPTTVLPVSPGSAAAIPVAGTPRFTG